MLKKFLTGACVAITLLSGCTSKQDDAPQQAKPLEPAEAPAAPPAAAPAAEPAAPPPAPAAPASTPSVTGLELAQKSGCLACHSIEKKLVGPAWKDVAARYRNNPDARAQLIAKVKQGGKGNWTEITGGTPMPPYSPRVADKDIEALVDFVLAL